MMAERVGVAKATYLKIERGDPSESMGACAMALFVLGFPEVLGDEIGVRKHDTGLLLDTQRLPRRVRIKKGSGPCEPHDQSVPGRCGTKDWHPSLRHAGQPIRIRRVS